MSLDKFILLVGKPQPWKIISGRLVAAWVTVQCKYVCVCIRVCVCVYMCVYIHVCVFVCIHTCVYMCVHVVCNYLITLSRHKSDSDLHQSLLQEQQAANLLPPYMGTQSLEYQQPIPVSNYMPTSMGYQPMKYNVGQSQRRGKRKFHVFMWAVETTVYLFHVGKRSLSGTNTIKLEDANIFARPRFT